MLIMIVLTLSTACKTMERAKDGISSSAFDSNSSPQTKRSLSGVLKSQEKEDLLRERIGKFWGAFIKEDYEQIYSIYDPFFRARTPKQAFFASIGNIKYHEYKIKDINIEGNIANVKLDIVYSITNLRVKTQVFNQPPTQTEIEEKWLYVYDNWYKEYYSHALESGIAQY